MTRDELLATLRDVKRREDEADRDRAAGLHRFGPDLEVLHMEADSALIAYINDSEVTAAFDAVGKWYS